MIKLGDLSHSFGKVDFQGISVISKVKFLAGHTMTQIQDKHAKIEHINNLNTSILTSMSLCVIPKIDTQKTCILKRLDCMLIIYYPLWVQ
jgi:hypothetical protein